jgi:hypothetical protein
LNGHKTVTTDDGAGLVLFSDSGGFLSWQAITLPQAYSMLSPAYGKKIALIISGILTAVLTLNIRGIL